MRSPYRVVFILCVLASETSYGRIKLAEHTEIVFAEVEQARRILTARDEFIRRMSPFDRAARMKTDQEVCEQDFLDFVGRNVMAWTDADKQRVELAFRGIAQQLGSWALPLPTQLHVIKTTGSEEGGAPYTRVNAIVIPEAVLRRNGPQLEGLICHELFHVMSRTDPNLREKCYEAIGFTRCGEIEFPRELKSRKITNPDAPKNDYSIRVRLDEREHWAVPILFSNAEKYDVNRGGPFFQYLQFQLLLVERTADSAQAVPIYEDGKPRLVGPQDVTGFFEQTGRNTQYIIHPEEILADNFAQLVRARRDVQSPEILKALQKILIEHKVTESVGSADAQKPLR